jgi:hypothetical protein
MPKFELYYRGNLLGCFDSIDDATEYYSTDPLGSGDYEIMVAP